MNLFATLLLGSLIADFPLQTNWIARMKSKGVMGLLPHILVYVFVTALLLRNPLQNMSFILLLGITHYAIDWTKTTLWPQCTTAAFIIDQIAHIVTLALFTWLAPMITSIPPEGILPTAVLYPALIYASFLGSLVCFWIWANNEGSEFVKKTGIQTNLEDGSSWFEFWTLVNALPMKWVQQQMLAVTQRAGMVLLGVITIFLFIL